MKTGKRIIGLLLAIMMMAVAAMPAFAASTNQIVVTSETAGHTYTAYQIFAGDYDSQSQKLSNVTWGSGVNGDALLIALKTDNTVGIDFSACKDAAAVAEKMSGATTEQADAFAKLAAANLSATGTASGAASGTAGNYTYTISNLADGYYFVNDAIADGSQDGNAYSKYMIQVAGGTVNVNAKTDTPSVTKKVLENNDASHKNTWNDAADYSVGDKVSFRLVGLVPDMANYETYVYQFNDTLSDGLSFDASSVKVYAANGASMDAVNTSTAVGASGTLLDAAAYTTTTSASGFTLGFADLKKVAGVAAGQYIVVEYTASLNGNAVVGNPGNPNEVTLTYSNNPNQSGSGSPSKGTTPKDEVVVFTFNMPVNKVVKDTKAPLTGASFAVFTDKTAADAAAKDPAQLDKALKFSGAAGNYMLGAAGTVTTLAADANGKYAVKGLDQGTYYLVETSAPSGYNRLTTALTVAVTPTYDGTSYVNGHAPDATNDQLTSIKVALNGGTAGDSVTVENSTGATLPSTGGIGTCIFTIGGIALMAAALVVLAAKRRTERSNH